MGSRHVFLQRPRNKERRFLPDLRPEIRINLWLYIRSEMWKIKTIGQKVNSVNASLPPASEPRSTRDFSSDTDQGLDSTTGNCVQPVLFTCLTSLASPWTEPGWEEASEVTACLRSSQNELTNAFWSGFSGADYLVVASAHPPATAPSLVTCLPLGHFASH